jgi:hypothetical protein
MHSKLVTAQCNGNTHSMWVSEILVRLRNAALSPAEEISGINILTHSNSHRDVLQVVT